MSGAHYNNAFDSIEKNTLFIQTYFKNSNALKKHEHITIENKARRGTNNILKSSMPIDQLYEEKLKRDQFKRNSKSNIHLRRENNVDIISHTDKEITSKMCKGRYIAESIKMNDKKVQNFINSFPNKNMHEVMDSKRKTFTVGIKDKYHSPSPAQKTQLIWFNKRKNTNPEERQQVDQFNAHSYDSAIIEMMQKLGYDVKDVYSGLVMGNHHLISVYQKLLKEKQDAINFMKSYHK